METYQKFLLGIFTLAFIYWLFFVLFPSPIVGGTPYTWLYHHQTLVAGSGAVLGAAVLLSQIVLARRADIANRNHEQRIAQQERDAVAMAIMAECEVNFLNLECFTRKPESFFRRFQHCSQMERGDFFSTEIFEVSKANIGFLPPPIAREVVAAYIQAESYFLDWVIRKDEVGKSKIGSRAFSLALKQLQEVSLDFAGTAQLIAEELKVELEEDLVTAVTKSKTPPNQPN